MNSNLKKITIGLCLLFALASFGSLQILAQDAIEQNKQSINKLVWEAARAKRSNQPFIILTPADLAGLSKEQLERLGDPCDSAQAINYGQTVAGQLSNTDCRLDDNSYADFYVFNGTQGDQVVVAMGSTAFDTYLGLANESGTFTVEDDDGGGGTNSRISTTLPATGLYVILANSALPNRFGNYSLSLSGGTVCSYTLSPQSMLVPASSATYTVNVTAPAGCQWTAFTTDSYITTNSSGTGSGVLTFSITQNPTNNQRFGSIRIGNTIFSVVQQEGTCTFTLNPTSINVSAAGTTGTFSVSGLTGCFWSINNYSSFISASGSGNGNGTVTYSIMGNNGADRVGYIYVGNQRFTVNQTGRNCTYSVTPTQIFAPRSGLNGTVTVNTQAGCTFFVSRSQNWITVQEGGGSGQTNLAFTVAAQPEAQSRTGAIQIFYSLNESSQSMSVFIEQNGNFRNPKFDFTRDGKADLVTFRPSNGGWYVQLADTLYRTHYWGLATDVLAPADYNGDGSTDIAVFRPSNGGWYIDTISNGQISLFFGANGDIPVPADYDGDGIDDIAVFRPSNGGWYIRRSSDQQISISQFGLAEDVPTVGDFDGDSRADIAVWRPSTGVWYRLNSSNNAFYAYQFGLSEDKPVAADFDGDGKTDISVWRPSNGVWYRINSSNNSFFATGFGLSEDKPVVADYDGDGKADIAVFRPSTSVWYISQSTSGFVAKQYGSSGDKPAQNAFTR